MRRPDTIVLLWKRIAIEIGDNAIEFLLVFLKIDRAAIVNSGYLFVLCQEDIGVQTLAAPNIQHCFEVEFVQQELQGLVTLFDMAEFSAKSGQVVIMLLYQLFVGGGPGQFFDDGSHVVYCVSLLASAL